MHWDAPRVCTGLTGNRGKEMVMRKDACAVGNRVRFGAAFVALVGATAFPLAALGADRVVLAEYFTSIG